MSEDRKLQEPEAGVSAQSATITPELREALRRDVMAEFDARMPITKKRFHEWRDWPGTWAFADAAVSVLVGHPKLTALSTPPAPEAASVVPELTDAQLLALGNAYAMAVISGRGAQAAKEMRALLPTPPVVRCAECDIENGCPEYCRCTPASPPLTAPAAPEAVGEATDEQIIARCEAAGMKWLPPFDNQPEDGDFKGAFDLSDIASLRKLLAATPLKQEGAEPMEMALCESISCVLREGQLYRFVKVGDCPKCSAMSAASFEAYGAPPSPQEPAPQGDKRDALTAEEHYYLGAILADEQIDELAAEHGIYGDHDLGGAVLCDIDDIRKFAHALLAARSGAKP